VEGNGVERPGIDDGPERSGGLAFMPSWTKSRPPPPCAAAIWIALRAGTGGHSQESARSQSRTRRVPETCMGPSSTTLPSPRGHRRRAQAPPSSPPQARGAPIHQPGARLQTPDADNGHNQGHQAPPPATGGGIPAAPKYSGGRRRSAIPNSRTSSEAQASQRGVAPLSGCSAGSWTSCEG